MGAIEFKDFSCYYENKKAPIQALSNIDLSVRQGEFLAIVGESGSGKSTLLKACLGLADLFTGELLMDGLPIEQLDLKTGRYAYVKQEYSLYPNKNIYENIAFPLRAMKTPQAEVDRRVKAVAKTIGMELFLTRKPKQLSGGQQQRVAIGRALVKNPTFLFFDEPFSNVDPQLRAGLRALVRDIHRQYRPTVLFVTHDLQEAFFLADRIVVLENGTIAEIGVPEQLRTAGVSAFIRNFVSIE